MVSPVDHDRPDMPDSDAEDGWSTEKTVAVGLVVAVGRLILAVALSAVVGSFGLGLGEEGDNTDGRGRVVRDDSLIVIIVGLFRIDRTTACGRIGKSLQ